MTLLLAVALPIRGRFGVSPPSAEVVLRLSEPPLLSEGEGHIISGDGLYRVGWMYEVWADIAGPLLLYYTSFLSSSVR